MARPLRFEIPGGYWHTWNRGVNFGDIVVDDIDRRSFVALLAEAVRRYKWVILQFTLMTNHFHLVFETPYPTLSRGMKWLEQKYVQRFNRRHGRVGPLFQGRYKHQAVENGTFLLGLLRYVALNPVRAKMVERPEQYEWSSYRCVAGFEKAPEWIDPAWVLGEFGLDPESQQREFRKFVDAGAGITRAPWRDAAGQWLIGSERWVESMRPLIEGKPRSTDHPAMQRYAARPRPAKIVEVVAEVFETTPEEIRSSHGTVERRVVAWLGCYEAMSRLGAIGAVLRLRSTSRVSELIAECDRDVDQKEHKHLRIAIDRCLDLLRRDLKPVVARHHEFYPAASGFATAPP
jgi:putative transposase